MTVLLKTRNVAKFILLAGLVWGLFSFFDWNLIVRNFTRQVVWGIFAAQIFLLAAAVPLSLRLSYFTHGTTVPFIHMFQAFFFAMGLNMILPARLSEFVKPVYLKLKAGVPFSSGISAVFLERTTDLIILGLMAAGTVGGVYIQLDWKIVVFIIVFPLIVLLSLPKLEIYLLKFIQCLPFFRLRSSSSSVLSHLSAPIRNGKVYPGTLLGVAGWTLSFLSVWIFFLLAGDIPIGISGTLAVFVGTTFAYAIPALPGGLGIYEAAAVFVLQSYGYSLEASLALGLSLHFSQIILGVMMTFIIIIKEDISIKYITGNILKQTKYNNENEKHSDSFF